jgi:GDP-4-dehydro-6-deoxy-D-mannose reductase
MNPDTILITGASGFVGRLLAQAEMEKGNKVIGIHDPAESPDLSFNSYPVDLRNSKALNEFINGIGVLEEVYHLAAISSVRMCQENPMLCFDVNVTGTLNLLDALSKLEAKPKVLFTSSCEVYGKVDPADLPIGEDTKTDPINIYGLSKLTAEGICRFFMREYGLPIVITRAFNHTGPGRPAHFVFPYVASTLAKIEKGELEPVLAMGNLSVIRDVLDARDVVRGYMKVMDKGNPGSIYNVASGRSISIEQGVRMLIEISGLNVKITQEESRMRAYDIPQLFADASRMEKDLGWRAEITLEQTFKDLLRYWRAKEGVS